jgi:hypothetical protein
VNWYAHAVVAERSSDDPLCLLGAMLPDLAAALRVRLSAAPDGALGRGVRLHGAADARFHAAPEFAALQSEGRARLAAAGLARGSARAAAHVGIELALDGWLARERPRSAAFAAALDAAGALADRPALFRGAFDPARWRELCRRLRAGELPEAWADPEWTARSVERALAPRARLALAPGDRDAIAGWLRAEARSIAARAPALLARCDA